MFYNNKNKTMLQLCSSKPVWVLVLCVVLVLYVLVSLVIVRLYGWLNFDGSFVPNMRVHSVVVYVHVMFW